MDYNGDHGSPRRDDYNMSSSYRHVEDSDDGMQRSASTTTISTIVLHRRAIKVVIALLQTGDAFHIKVVELEPRLTYLGANLDEAVQLQKQNDELLANLEGLPNPIDEFLRKVDEMIDSRRPREEILNAMETSITRVWEDVESLLARRKHIADVNSNFHEKLVTCQSKIDALELACRDTMIPMEVEPVEEFLQKFRALRADVLASVMATLKDGKELLSLLREITTEGTVDSRPDHLVADAVKAIRQVEVWLEQLHDRRNSLELAWQSRREQLEQCLRLAILTKEINELEIRLYSRQNDISIAFSLGDSEKSVVALLREYEHLKRDAVDFRDKGLRLAKATEQLVESGSFAGDETCARAYAVLAKCTDFYTETEHQEALLGQSRLFFKAAEKALLDLGAIAERAKNLSASSNGVQEYTKILEQVNAVTAEPIQMGYCLIDDVGRTLPEVQGVQLTIDKLENQKAHLEKICSVNAKHEINISEKINVFFSHHNQILSWLISNAEEFIKANASMGRNLLSAQTFLHNHYKLLADLETKGTDINKLLLILTTVLENLDETQRKDVDTKVETLHKHWTQLKNVAQARIDLASVYIQFLDESESLTKVFDEVELILRTSPNEENLKQIEKAWAVIKPSYGEIKKTGGRIVDELSKVADPYLDRQAPRSTVEEILDGFSKRQFTITESCEHWSQTMTEKREIEILWERTMSENVQTLNAAAVIDKNLYPILTIPSEDPQELKVCVQGRLKQVTAEIDGAKQALQERIKSTSHLEPTDDETNTKLHQVIDNLQSIKVKLDTLNTDYEALAISMISFFDSIITTKQRIEEYFERNRDVSTADPILSHADFRQKTMEHFRSLISQSETIIQRIRNQEPEGAKEHDTDRIITLLERLRIAFESQADTKQSELIEYNALNQFKRELRDINQNLDDVTQQLSNSHQASAREDHTSALANSQMFEYLEQTVELTKNRIDNFNATSTAIYAKQPKLEEAIKGDLAQLTRRWQDILQMVRDRRLNIDSTVSYYKMLDEIKRECLEHSGRLQEITTRAAFVNNVAEAQSLIQQIDEYINHHETNQLNALRRLSDASRGLFGFDTSVAIYSENITVFDTFLKTKAKLVDYLREEQTKERILAEERLKEPPAQPPAFYQSLLDAKVQEGDRFVFKCAVRGTPTPNVEWFKDGISIQNNSDYQTTFNNGLCTLAIEEAMTADTANFHCRATNAAGQDETLARLTVTENITAEKLEAPVVVVPLTTSFAKEKLPFTFGCTFTGHPLPIVQWFKNNNCIDQLPDYTITYNNGQANLKINEVCLEDQTSFMCRATNPVGAAETIANLIVQPTEPGEPPFFTQPLTNVMARVGQKLILECIVSGQPIPQLVWTQNNKAITHPEAKITFDGQKGTLVIPEAFLNNAGEYTVSAQNPIGTSFSTCNVTVKGRVPNETSDSEFASDAEPIKPSVQMPLRDCMVNESKSIRMDCIIVGQPEPEVIWYHNGRPVKESSDIRLLFQGDRCSILIQEALTEDSGEYKVVAINSAGEISSQCHLTVIPKPQVDDSEEIIPLQFTKLLTDVLAPEGERIVFEGAVVGKPAPQISWLFNNTSIVPDSRIEISQDLAGNLKLTINSVTLADKGLYTVKASNPSGDIKSFSHLIVKAVNVGDKMANNSELQEEERFICPMFKELFSDKHVAEGEATKFECIVIGKPTPKIKWLFNDEPVHGKQFLISTSGDRQVLSIPEVTRSISGKVACVAENSVGKVTCVAYLNILHPSAIGQQHHPESQMFTQEHNTQSSLVTIRKQTFTSTSHQHIDSSENGVPQMQIYSHDKPLQIDATDNTQFQEYRQTNDGNSGFQEKSVINVIRPVTVEAKLVRRDIPPRFVTPLTGKIVDQGADVTLEAIVDGFPTPEINVYKNGVPLQESANRNIRFEHNKVTVHLQRVGIEDAGRYSCIANSPVGTSTSVADVVVKKSIFPPVFGRRLQTQIVKIGEKVIMDVEVTGLPEPEVKWFKDDVLIQNHPRYKLQQIGNCYKLIIEQTTKMDAGKFMVSATNPGGDAESIASFAVVDTTPDRIVEVVKTVVYEDPKERTRKTESSDTHGKSESTDVIETRKVIEASMRMEHKQTLDLDDLKLTFKPSTLQAINTNNITRTFSPKPFERPFLNQTPIMSSSPIPSADALSMERQWTNHSTSEFSQKTSLSSTKQMFEEKIKQTAEEALKAPKPTAPARPGAWKERPKSDIYSDLYLEPEPEPEICYAPKPKYERKKSLVETLEESIEQQLEKEPERIPPGGVRLIPTKREKSLPPAPTVEQPAYVPSRAITPKPDLVLEPFPFSVPAPTDEKPKPVVGQAPTPSKFIKGTFSDTNYESDFSDYSYFEKKFKHVTPPRPKSTDPIQVPQQVPRAETPKYDFTALPLKEMIQRGTPIPLPEPYTPAPSVITTCPITQKLRPVSGYAADTEENSHYSTRPENRIYNQEVSTSSIMKNISMTSKHIKIMEEPLLEPEIKKVAKAPVPQPARFVKSEYRESETESDFEGRNAGMWKATDSDSEPQYRPIRITPTMPAKQAPMPVRQPEQVQPKFKSIEKPTPLVQQFHKNHVINSQTSSTSRTYHSPAQKQQPPPPSAMYFKSITGQPIHNAIETTNTMQMHEHSETNQRVVNMNHTTRIINFENQLYGQPEPFPYSASPGAYNYSVQSNMRVAPPPTPTKFVKGEFRESDYDSEIDGTRIRPVWTPNPYDSDEPQYRRVNAPNGTRSTSCPRSSQWQQPPKSPMEFDTQPPYQPVSQAQLRSSPQQQQPPQGYTTQTLDRSYYSKNRQTFDMNQATAKASEMSDQFKMKAQNFVKEFETRQPNRPHSVAAAGPPSAHEPQVYRDESRVSQHGTKHIDPNTGLIYFKYDFGYEFGILFPGEGKKIVGGAGATARPIAPRARDIDVPVIHERTRNKPDERYVDPAKRYSLPVQIDLDRLHDPNYKILLPERDIQRGQSIPRQDTVPVNYHNIHHGDKPKRPPMFITPLKDIAVVSGQTARFECIVQCENTPTISWTKDGQLLACHPPKHLIEFRNGVCRLTTTNTGPADGGLYSCSASNQLGSVTTSSRLMVPADKWGTRK